MNLCDEIRGPLVNPIGLKEVELPFLHDNLVPGTCLLVGEGNEGGHEGVAAAALYNPTVSRPIDCVDIFPLVKGSFIDQEQQKGNIRFFQRDFIAQPEGVMYDNVGCINVLEHFGFVGMTEGLISLNHDLKGLSKMMAICSKRIILTIPFGFRVFSDDEIPTGRFYTKERMELISKLFISSGFSITKNYTVRNNNFHPGIYDISKDQLALEMGYHIGAQYLKLLVIDRVST